VTVEAPPAPPPMRRGWARPAIALLAALGLLLLGAAAGLLVGLPGSSASSVPAADSVDVGFAQDMSEHHQQAVQMASWERDHTTDPALKQLAFDIETTQLQQIGQMQGWLGLWGAAADAPDGKHMAWMVSSDHAHGVSSGSGGVSVGGVETMPGMASSDQLRALRALSGPQLDVLFLQLMLRHHQGGAVMLQYGADHASVPEVRNLAAQMLSSQTSESEYLSQLLAARGGTPLPL
jgi:uncharacterized protein (DUF305 family)